MNVKGVNWHVCHSSTHRIIILVYIVQVCLTYPDGVTLPKKELVVEGRADRSKKYD